MADVKDFEFDFSDLEKPVNDLGDGGNAFAGSDDIRYSENKNMNVSNQSGKKSFTFREFGLADYYDFLTDETKGTYTKDFIKKIDSEAGINEEAGRLADIGSSLTMDDVKTQIEKVRNDLFSEVVAKQYLVLQAGGQMDKVPETKTRAELEAAFNALPGANYAEDRISKNGNVYKTQPCVVDEDDKKNYLWFSFASKDGIDSLNQFKDRFERLVAWDKSGFYGKVLHFDEVKKALSEEPYVKLSAYNDLQKVKRDYNKILDLDAAVKPYYDEKTFAEVRNKMLESPDVLKAYVAEAEKHFQKVDLNGVVAYTDKKTNTVKERKGAVCSGGYANLNQINELVSARRQEITDKIYAEACRPRIIENLKVEAKKEFYDKVKAAAFKKMNSEKRNKLTQEEIDAIKDKVNNFKVCAEDLKKTEQKADAMFASNRNNLGKIFTVDELVKVQDEISAKISAAITEEKDKLARKSYDEVAAEINKLPISESQKFALNFINGVDTKATENLNRGAAQTMLDNLTEQRRGQEVAPDVRAYAEKYHLVKPGEVYTNARWNEDSKTVPPMDNIVKLAEDLNCMYQLVNKYDSINKDYKKGENSYDKLARYEEIMNNGGKDGKKPLTQADFIDVVTARYKEIDEKKNGPVSEYQKNAGFGLCKNWYEAETGFLRKCCAEKLLGAVQAEYALNKAINPSVTYEGVNLNDVYGIKGCDINKLLDPKLTREQQLELAESCREAINKDMAQNYKDRICGFEKDLTKTDRIGYFVKESLRKVCKDCKSVDDYVAKTKDPDVVLNGVKDFLQSSGKYYITESNLKYVAKAYVERVPGIVETKGSRKEIMDQISARVDAILKPIAVGNTGNGSKEAKTAAKSTARSQSQNGNKAGSANPKDKGSLSY